jgi:Flp pilus assembly protein TadG
MIARRRAGTGERGMTIVVIGVSLMMLMTVTAFVVDLSFLRNDRRADQKIADAAATAGALELSTSHGRDACTTALRYLEANTPDVTSFTGADCSGFVQFCDPSTVAVSTTGAAGPYRIQIVHPVPDSHPLMQRASAIGAPAAAVTAADGSRCDRVGVSIRYVRAPAFASVLGGGNQSTGVHAVAKAKSLVGGDRPINLLILERTDCSAVVVDGQPLLIVGAITGRDGKLMPGILAVDSDGTGTNCPNLTDNGTLHAQGTSALARADGPLYCPAELVAGTGQGCGVIELYAPGVPGPASPLYCEGGFYKPACTSTATIRPHPVRMAARRTREPVDHHFNCNSGYGSKPWYGDHPIGACPGAGSTTDYVDELLSFAGGSSTPTGFSVYGDEATEPCTVDGQKSIVVPEGNVRVICAPFQVKRPVTFTGGNVIFDGDVFVTSSGDLRIHACGQQGVNNCAAPDKLTWTPPVRDDKGNITVAGDDFDETTYSDDAAWVVLRDGAGLHKDAGSQIRLFDTSVFIPRTADLGTGQAMAMAGGNGALVWHAPREGPFDVLAMWSDAPSQHDLGGQATLEMEGVYFAPVARLTFRGTGGQDQVAAQLITERLTVSGGGTLKVVPDINRSLTWWSSPESTIVR